MPPSGPDNDYGENSFMYWGTSVEFKPTAIPIIRRANNNVPKCRGNYRPYPIIPKISVNTKASLKLIELSKGPALKAPKAAPIAGKAYI